MSVCNSCVAVVTKDLLVLFPSAGFWPLAPITERSQPAAISTFPSIIYTFHRGHVHPSICSPHTPTSSRPPSVCIFACSLFFFFFILSPLEILLIAILVLSAFFSNHQPLPVQHTRALMLETADSLPRARFLLQGQTSSNLADMRHATARFR